MELLLDGKLASQALIEELKIKTAERVAGGKRAPHLAAILVGQDGGSLTYVNNKIKTCERIGYGSTLLHFEADISQEALLAEVEKLNADPAIDGYIVQLPLPKHIDEAEVLQAVDYRKDVDGFHPINTGRMVKGLPSFVAATPLGIMKILEHYQIETSGKHAVVLGRSNIVGTPMSILLSRATEPGNCTVTLCHSRTKNLTEVCASADILVAALGKPLFVKADMVKEGAVVIDVGTTRVPDDTAKRGWRLKGDVDFQDVKEKASAITPVPGGVGPMTIAGLMWNTWLAAENLVYPKA